MVSYFKLTLLCLLLVTSGCQSGPIGPDGKFNWGRKENNSNDTDTTGSSTGATEANSAASPLEKLTADNESLHAELAKARQQYRVTVGELDLVKQQLKDANAKLSNSGGVDLSAGNAEAASTLDVVSIEGVVVGRDGKRVRIELPRTQLFNANTVTISNDGKTLLDRVAAAIKQQYVNQQITLEAHATSGLTPNDDHQQAIQQVTTIYNYLVGMSQLPATQLSLASKGNNAPRYSTASEQGREANQRIELIIYPETY